MAAVVIPTILLFLAGSNTFGLRESAPALRVVLAFLGVVFVCLGLALMIATIRLFVTVGKGTLAPWNPTQRLVVQGVYRHVRNPMISGVFFVLLGETLLAVFLPLFGWFAVFVIGNSIYIPMTEEPGLLRRFGEEYRTYQHNVPCWIPRLTPWQGVDS